jgi:hypothetical protein
MSYHLLYETCGWHTRCALFDEQGRLLTLRYDDIHRQLIEGAIVWSRVRTISTGMGAAFVDIGDFQDALLPLNTLPSGTKLHQGQSLLARITRGGFAEKGARLDARVATPPPAAHTACPSLLVRAPTALKRALRDAGSTPVKVWLPHGLARDEVAKFVPEKAIFQLNEAQDAPDVLTTLETMLAQIIAPIPTFTFPHGDVKVELTSAVATIDINFKPLQANHQATVLAANLSAADEVARLVRLLDLGGSVVVDFITPKSKAHRDLIDSHLEANLSTTDDHFEHLRPMSRHGLSEITRARTGPSLNLLLKTPAFVAGNAALNLWRTPAGANPRLQNQKLVAHEQVLKFLQPHLTHEACLRTLGRPITLQTDNTLGLAEVKISG